MPELAEVEFSRRQWNAGLGDTVHSVSLHPRTRIFRDVSPTTLRKTIVKRTLRTSRAHGKRLLFSFAPDLHLEFHLGMSGRLSVAAPDRRPAKHDHLVLHQRKRSLVFNDYRQFGRVLLHDRPGPWSDLPPQPLESGFTGKRIAAFLSRHARTAIKPLLLDQALFPGIGNWMADEILWRAGIHPATLAAETDAALLRKEIRAVCRGALRHVVPGIPGHLKIAKVESSGDPSSSHHLEPPEWGSPPRSWLFQHRWKDGGSCPRCRSPLTRVSLRQRTTCYCPRCQDPHL